jgi:hypothetical protein
MNLTFSALKNMSEQDRNDSLGKLVTAAKGKPNGQMTSLEATIRGYEHKFGMTSDELLARLERGEQAETLEIGNWLFALSTRKRVLGP